MPLGLESVNQGILWFSPDYPHCFIYFPRYIRAPDLRNTRCMFKKRKLSAIFIHSCSYPLHTGEEYGQRDFSRN